MPSLSAALKLKLWIVQCKHYHDPCVFATIVRFTIDIILNASERADLSPARVYGDKLITKIDFPGPAEQTDGRLRWGHYGGTGITN